MNVVLWRGGVLLALLAVFAGDAHGQVLEAPPRSSGGLFGGRRPIDPNRSHQELTLSVHALGGYDDNLSPEGLPVTVEPYRPRESGYTGLVAGSLRYWRGYTARSFEANARVNFTSYSALVSGSVVGGDAVIRGTTSLGARTSLTGSGRTEYRPTFTLGQPDLLADSLGASAPQEVDATQGVSELASWTTAATVGLQHNWTRRHRTSVGYDGSQRRFASDAGLDSLSHAAMLAHTWDFLRTTGIRLSYRYADDEVEVQGVGDRPLKSHAAELGLTWRKAVSPTRSVSFSGGGGATHVRTVVGPEALRLEYTVPSAFGLARLDLGRTWTLSSDYRRSVSFLEGISQESFVIHSALLSVAGQTGRRVAVALTGNFSTGDAPEGRVGSFESLTGTFQVSYAIRRWISVVSNYSYYSHLLRGTTVVPAGFPTRFERNAIRVGVTISVPLYGTFPAGSQAPASQNERL